MDGNFAAEHMQMKLPEDDVWLSDGLGFFVKREPYQLHLRNALDTYEVIIIFSVFKMYSS